LDRAVGDGRGDGRRDAGVVAVGRQGVEEVAAGVEAGEVHRQVDVGHPGGGEDDVGTARAGDDEQQGCGHAGGETDAVGGGEVAALGHEVEGAAGEAV